MIALSRNVSLQPLTPSLAFSVLTSQWYIAGKGQGKALMCSLDNFGWVWTTSDFFSHSHTHITKNITFCTMGRTLLSWQRVLIRHTHTFMHIHNGYTTVWNWNTRLSCYLIMWHPFRADEIFIAVKWNWVSKSGSCSSGKLILPYCNHVFIHSAFRLFAATAARTCND